MKYIILFFIVLSFSSRASASVQRLCFEMFGNTCAVVRTNDVTGVSEVVTSNINLFQNLKLKDQTARVALVSEQEMDTISQGALPQKDVGEGEMKAWEDAYKVKWKSVLYCAGGVFTCGSTLISAVAAKEKSQINQALTLGVGAYFACMITIAQCDDIKKAIEDEEKAKAAYEKAIQTPQAISTGGGDDTPDPSAGMGHGDPFDVGSAGGCTSLRGTKVTVEGHTTIGPRMVICPF